MLKTCRIEDIIIFRVSNIRIQTYLPSSCKPNIYPMNNLRIKTHEVYSNTMVMKYNLPMELVILKLIKNRNLKYATNNNININGTNKS